MQAVYKFDKVITVVVVVVVVVAVVVVARFAGVCVETYFAAVWEFCGSMTCVQNN